MPAAPIEQPTPPSYPPKTPPPPKKPASPPRPETADGGSGGLVRSARCGVVMRGRRGANWVYAANRWAPNKAKEAVLTQLAAWDFRPGQSVLDAVEAVTVLLVATTVADQGHRVSVHLSDQDGQACILALSHHPGLADLDDDAGPEVLHQVTAHRPVTECGMDTGPDGRRVWAVVDL